MCLIESKQTTSQSCCTLHDTHVQRLCGARQFWSMKKKIKKNKNKNIKCINSHQQKQLAREYPLNIVQMATMKKKKTNQQKNVYYLIRTKLRILEINF